MKINSEFTPDEITSIATLLKTIEDFSKNPDAKECLALKILVEVSSGATLLKLASKIMDVS